MTRLQGSGRRALAAMALLGLAVSVAACHHHDDDRAESQPPVGGTQNPPTVTDAFVAYVTQVVATQDETSEPASIDGVAATSPEETEPLPLPGS